MKVEILMNGTYKLVLIPENEVEKGILNAISKTEVDAKSIEQHTQILDKVVQEGLVITSKTTVT